MSWPKTPDGQYYIFEGLVYMPVDPSTGVAQLYLRPQGGMAVGVPPIESGPPGPPPTIDLSVNYTPLAYDDITPSSMSWSQPAPNAYKLNAALHDGKPGDDGDTVLDPGDYEGILPGQMLVVSNDSTEFIPATPKVGDFYLPATIRSTPSGNASYTLAQIPVPAQQWPWRPIVFGTTTVVGTGNDVRVDLVARLNGESGGNIVGRGWGQSGQNPPPLYLSGGSPTGQPDTYNRVEAGVPATLYLRVERQSGADTFVTSASSTSFAVKVNPVP